MKRRTFLTGLAGSTAFALSGMTLLAPREARAATVSVDLVAEGSFKTMVDGVSIFTWRFRGSDGAGPGALSSGLAVGEGDTINVTVTNDLDRPINWVIPGVLDNTAPVSPGASRTYTFSAPAAGSYFFTDGVNGDIGRAMGLSGPLVVMPDDASNLIYTGGPGFDRQYTLVLSELDDRLNSAVQAGGSYNMADYEPNYFFVNGLGFPATRSDSDTLVKMNVGEDVAMRFINAGCITNPMHFHGYHVKVATRNRAPVTDVIDKDTVLVGLGECVDVILRVNQPGDFPLHTHFLPGVTANGVYVNPYGGALITLSAA